MGPENVAGMTDYVKKLYTAVDTGSGGRTREEVRSELEKLGWDEAQVDATVQSVGWEGAQTYLLLKKQRWDDELINLIFSRIGL